MNEKSLARRGAGDSSGDGDDNGDDNSDCLSNREAYIGDGCCAGTCAENGYGGCYGCATTSDQDPVNYGGPSCFHAGACIALHDGDWDDDGGVYGYSGYPSSGYISGYNSGYSGSGNLPNCLTNQEAYIGDGCCSGKCATSLNACYDCPEKGKKNKNNVGGPACFREGACIAAEPKGSCPAPASKRVRGTGTEYAGWCICPGGSFCQGDGCTSNVTTATGVASSPRNRWDPDTVSCVSKVLY